MLVGLPALGMVIQWLFRVGSGLFRFAWITRVMPADGFYIARSRAAVAHRVANRWNSLGVQGLQEDH